MSYLKSPLVWMPLSLLAAPLALWGMLASNRNRMRQNLRRGGVINPAANVANPALAIPLLAIKSVEAEQPQASSEKQEASMLLPESINKNPHLKPNKLNKGAIRDNKLKPLTALPMYHSHQNNNTSQITHCLNSSQTESNTPVTAPYSQMDMAGNYTVFKWLCGFFGKRSMVDHLNESEKISLRETDYSPLDEAEDRLRKSIEMYGNKSSFSQKLYNSPAKNQASSNNRLLFFSAPLAQSTEEMHSISSKKLLAGGR